jgi:hypothetical protein
MTKDYSPEKKAALLKAIDNALTGMGEPVKKTVMWHLNDQGVYIGCNNIDVLRLYSTLEQLIGSGADVVFNEVYSELEKQLTPDILTRLDSESCHDCPLTRIEKLLNAGGNN